jgi:hypothetical protein
MLKRRLNDAGLSDAFSPRWKWHSGSPDMLTAGQRSYTTGAVRLSRFARHAAAKMDKVFDRCAIIHTFVSPELPIVRRLPDANGLNFQNRSLSG